MIAEKYFIGLISKSIILGLLIAITANILGEFKPYMVIAMGLLVLGWSYVAAMNSFENVSKQFKFMVFICTVLPYISSIYGTGPINSLAQILGITIILSIFVRPITFVTYGIVNINILFFLGLNIGIVDQYTFTVQYLIVTVSILVLHKAIHFKNFEIEIISGFLGSDICKLYIDENMVIRDSYNVSEVMGIEKFNLEIFLESINNEDKKFILEGLEGKNNGRRIAPFNGKFFNMSIMSTKGLYVITFVDITEEVQSNKLLNKLYINSTYEKETIIRSINENLKILSIYADLLDELDSDVRKQAVKNIQTLCIDSYSKIHNPNKKIITKIKGIYNLFSSIKSFAQEEEIKYVGTNARKGYFCDLDSLLIILRNLKNTINEHFKYDGLEIHISDTGNVELDFVVKNVKSKDGIDYKFSLDTLNNEYSYIDYYIQDYNGSFKIVEREGDIYYQIKLRLRKFELIGSDLLVKLKSVVRGKKVAIVDKSDVTRKLFGEYISNLCDLYDFKDKKDLSHYICKDLDIIFIDDNRSGKDSQEFIHFLNDNGFTGKIICMSTRTNLEDYKSFYDLGFQGYLKKPIKRSNLYNKLLEFLE